MKGVGLPGWRGPQVRNEILTFNFITDDRNHLSRWLPINGPRSWKPAFLLMMPSLETFQRPLHIQLILENNR